MMGLLGNLAFLNPWALAGLAALPALYFLLRLTPPPPRTIAFPARRFLEGLTPKQNTPSRTPWWILLLRLMIAALLLIALARPVLNPQTPTSAHNGPLLLLIDTSWAAAKNWNDIRAEAENLTRKAGRQNREIFILTTAAPQKPELPGPLTQSAALSTIGGLKPVPWDARLHDLTELTSLFDGQIMFLSGGLQNPGYKALIKSLEERDLTLYSPKDAQLPLLLKSPDRLRENPTITLDGPRDLPARPIQIELLGSRGALLDTLTIETEKLPIEVSFDVPSELRSKAAGFRIAGEKSAASRFWFDSSGGPKTVGLVAPEEAAQARQLTEDSFFLSKALEPYATLHHGTLEDILKAKPSIIILPDIGAMPTDALNTLGKWVDQGGVLLRFAGPNMAGSSAPDPLTPVRLRRETRSTQGSLSWDKPLKIAPFAPQSPLYGLDIEDDIEIYEYILPEISEGLEERTWAALEDGTPLITAAQREAGLIVMIHTAAAPTWSNLPLSGLYVQILKRVLSFAGRTQSLTQAQSGLLQPASVMDGFGQLHSPEAHVEPIDAAQFDETAPGPSHPPGFYGHTGMQRALNLGDHLKMPQAIDTPGALAYNQHFETDLTPFLVTAAFALFLIDALIMLALSLPFFRRGFAILLLALALTAPAPSQAQTPGPAQDLYLAYIKTGNPAIDATSQKGLNILATALRNRTSAEPAGVVPVDPARDTLAFFPLLYWPISSAQTPPSTEALYNLQAYLDHGGTILIDTRDGGANPQHLRQMIGGLNIPPLTELPKDHVLTKSFYLLKHPRARFDSGPLWVESQSASGRDGVSSIILSSHDWAGYWAQLGTTEGLERTYITGGTQDHEMALRFGINLVMYALTGNYKADQVHVTHILERLGRERQAPQ